MTSPLQRRIIMLLTAAITGWLAWLWIPGSVLDRFAFAAVARGFSNPPFFITGEGAHSHPWNLRTFASTAVPDRDLSPVVISLGDDLEGIFQTTPPSPIDLAVILTNLQRLGTGKTATATVLAWDSPDPIGLAALDKSIGRFDSLVMAAPLSRGAVPEPMPPSFRRASIPLSSIQGDTSLITTVNRISLPGVILGKDNTMAGFQTLETESDRNTATLIARWEDRVVFAFPLLIALQQLGLAVDGVRIRPGEFLELGSNGPTIPIDRSGRLMVLPKKIAPRAIIPAEALIDGTENILPQPMKGSMILRDDRSAAEPATRAFSNNLTALIATIASDTGLTQIREFKRPRLAAELGILSFAALAVAAFCSFPAFTRNICFTTLASVVFAAQCLAAAAAAIWLPGLPCVVAIGVAVLVSPFLPRMTTVPRPMKLRPTIINMNKKPASEPDPAPVKATAVSSKKSSATPDKKETAKPGKKQAAKPSKKEAGKAPPAKKAPSKKTQIRKKRSN